jgi:hypothetical protein
MKHIETVIKLILAALLACCLYKMPYSYYNFVRVACCIGFAWLAYKEFLKQRIVTGLILIALAILFNPIAKITMKKDEWNKIDIGIAVILVIWSITELLSLRYGKSKKENKA